jgi:DNA-directed RNA polymerase subunit omega
MNGELMDKALKIVVNPNILVNLVSRRVRQLNSGGGGMSRPLVADTANMGVGDIALLEIVEGKMGWEMPEIVEVLRRRSNGDSSWGDLARRIRERI